MSVSRVDGSTVQADLTGRGAVITTWVVFPGK